MSWLVLFAFIFCAHYSSWVATQGFISHIINWLIIVCKEISIENPWMVHVLVIITITEILYQWAIICGGMKISLVSTRRQAFYHQDFKTGLPAWLPLFFNIPIYTSIFDLLNFETNYAVNVQYWYIKYYKYIATIKCGVSNWYNNIDTCIVFGLLLKKTCRNAPKPSMNAPNTLTAQKNTPGTENLAGCNTWVSTYITVNTFYPKQIFCECFSGQSTQLCCGFSPRPLLHPSHNLQKF